MACKDVDQSTQTDTTHRNMEVELPCIEGMLAGTLALMTGYAEHQGVQGKTDCRTVMAKKIVSNLLFLTNHPQMPRTLSLVMRKLQNHWHTLGALVELESESAQKTQFSTNQNSVLAPVSSSLPQQANFDSTLLWHGQHVSVQ